MVCKRVFDVLVSLVLLIGLSPVLALTAIAVKLDSSGPVIFRQRRAGRNDGEFFMYKFRTMQIGTPEVATDKLENPGRYVTAVGHYLRKYSLDELPQLVNILLGQMSLVGPRPALYNQYALRELRNRLDVSKERPGLTGWAQINGRDEIALEEKVNLDKHYSEHRSFGLDLAILLRTASRVYDGSGVAK